MTKLHKFVYDTLLPQCKALTAKLREPAEAPSEEIKTMVTLIRDMTKGLGDGPAQSWATLAALATGNPKLAKAAELARNRSQYETGQVVVVESDKCSSGIKHGVPFMVYLGHENNVLTVGGSRSGYFSIRNGDEVTTDARPATDAEIKECLEKLTTAQLNIIVAPNQPFAKLLA